MKQLLIEAVFVGVALIVVGSIVGGIIAYILSTDLPKVCKNWNKYHVMEISLFLSGFLLHILCEISGLNKWYCKNSYACKSLK